MGLIADRFFSNKQVQVQHFAMRLFHTNKLQRNRHFIEEKRVHGTCVLGDVGENTYFD